MRKKTCCVLITALFMSYLFLAFNTLHVESITKTWTVDSKGAADFISIQEAINAASQGDTIYIYAGIYRENVVANKTVSLIGENRETTIIDGMKNGNTLAITADSVIVTDLTIQGASDYGLYLINTRNTEIHDNILRNNHYGLFAMYSSDSILNNNTVVDNTVGIQIDASTRFSLENNTIAGNKYNFGVWGHELSDFIHNVNSSNKVNTKPIYYLVNQHGQNIPADAGYVAVINSTNISVKNLILTNNSAAVLIAYTTESKIQNVTMTNNSYGIEMVSGFRNIVSDNSIRASVVAILISYSENNTLAQNLMENNGRVIELDRSDYTNVTGNYIENGTSGISFSGGRNNIIENNTITNIRGSGNAISLSTINATVYGNTIKSNDLGLLANFYDGSTYKIYNNNFIDNTRQVGLSNYPSVIWDNGYPVGGNYWSAYAGTDLYSGLYQNVPGSDGIGDTPSMIDGILDKYPLMQQYRGSIRNLETGRSYPTIQQAVNDAEEGNRIFVFSGTYYDHIVLNKTISLLGENKRTTIIDGGGTGTPVYINSNNVKLAGFTIQNSGVGSTMPFSGIRISLANGSEIDNNIITDNEYGLWLDSGSNSGNISRNDIANNTYGICLSHASGNIIYFNNFANNSINVSIEDSHNNIWDNGYAGNYWKDYNGTDSDENGIGDTYLPWHGVDNYPLMNPYWNTADVNHDLKIDIKDLATAAKAFGSGPNKPHWNPACDMNQDSLIDIMDLAIIAKCYGEAY